jgi:hypothetical protein
MHEPAAVTLGADYVVPEEEQTLARARETYPALLRRLSHQSVVKHFDAYADIDWDSEEFRIDPSDSRWELGEDDALGGTAWYRSQPPEARARIGLQMYATFMKIGTQFESVLKRGLLDFAATLPNGSPEFRYVYHEIIEEAHHSLMFQEFVNRTGMDIPGLPGVVRFAARRVVGLARRFPELFFFFVLGGEDPIDHVQRTQLRSGRPMHPLLKRIMQIHVTEEARHLCFARHYLKQNVPRLGAFRKFLLAVRTPFLLGGMSQLMMRPSPQIVRTYHIPKSVLAEAYSRNPQHRQSTVDAVRKVRGLCMELGILNPGLWKLLGIWDAAARGEPVTV